MAHAAIAFAKAHFRRRMMACTTSIGPGATNLITAAATAHVNRLPVLFLPGDVFVSRAPDPVLQQVEDFHDGGVSANDCFKPVSRYFDRIVAPSQLLTALPRAIAVLTDPAQCGPVTLALPQDVQARGVRLSGGVLRADARAHPRAAAGGDRARRRGGAAARGEAAGDRRRRRRALQRRRRRRAAPVRRGASRAGRRDAGGQERAAVGPSAAGGRRSASPAARRPMRSRATPISCSPSARGCRTSRPARTRCSRRRGSSRSTSTRSMRSSGARPPCIGDAAATLDALSDAPGRLDGAARRGRRRRRAKRDAWRDDGVGDRRRARGRAAGAALRRRGDRRGPALAPAVGGARHRRLRGGHAARPSCTSSGAPRGPAATTWNTATRAWATRSPAASASRWRIRSARSS